jgi:hypothetical protein
MLKLERLALVIGAFIGAAEETGWRQEKLKRLDALLDAFREATPLYSAAGDAALQQEEREVRRMAEQVSNLANVEDWVRV